MLNTDPLISFTFDDFPRSALHIGGEILKSYGFKGTYYAAFSLLGRDSPVGPIFVESDLASLLADGHELGCHTFAHSNAWITPVHAFEKSLLDNRRALARVLPNAAFSTMSYPIADPHPLNKRAASSCYACCRGGGQTFNSRTLDRNHLRGFFVEQSRDNPDHIKKVIDLNASANGWLIFATHDVSEAPSRFGCTPRIFGEIVSYAAQSGAIVLPVFAAWRAVCGETERTTAPSPTKTL
jgi:peptidoglycan/xylan/chitin deacetylase (PgdA/CDA1 family)